MVPSVGVGQPTCGAGGRTARKGQGIEKDGPPDGGRRPGTAYSPACECFVLLRKDSRAESNPQLSELYRRREIKCKRSRPESNPQRGSLFPYGEFIPPTLNLFGNRDFDKVN